jgi:uncharacterized protein (DUF4213/DUF364 family)
MGVVQGVAESVLNHSRGRRIARVFVGFGYTAVALDDERAGVAYTFPKGPHCHPLNHAEEAVAVGKKVEEVVSHLGKSNLLLSSIAMAASNAVLTSLGWPEKGSSGDVMENVTVQEGDRVCMIGCFLPVMKTLRTMNVELVSVDETPDPGSNPTGAVRENLSRSQVAIITGTAVINDTIDGLLDLAGSCREVVVLGPSTPMHRDVYGGTSVSCISGVRVSDPREVFRAVADGGGFRAFTRFVQKINLRLR